MRLIDQTREEIIMADTRILTLTDKKKLEEQLEELNVERKKVA